MRESDIFKIYKTKYSIQLDLKLFFGVISAKVSKYIVLI